MFVIALIPARSGSSLRDKNIRALAGHPLLAYSINAAFRVSTIDRIVVSTDSQEYADIAINYGAEAPFLRPLDISGDWATDYEFVAHALEWIRVNDGVLPDYIVHLRPTTPLREPSYIAQAIDALAATPQATALRSVHLMSESAYKCFEIDGPLSYLRTVGRRSFALDEANRERQVFPKTYYPNGYVDVLRVEHVLAQHCIHGNRVMPLVTPRVTEVDTEEDFALLEWEVARNPGIVKALF